MFAVISILSLLYNPPMLPFDFSECQNPTPVTIYEDGSYTNGSMLPRQILLDLCTENAQYKDGFIFNNNYIFKL